MELFGITLIDKWAHLAGVFLLTMVIRRARIFTRKQIVVAMCLGMILLEVYQMIWQPWYGMKYWDTLVDLVAGGVGLLLALAY